MVTEVDPRQTKRAAAFKLWMQAPMPMVTLFFTLNITHLLKISGKSKYKLNMLLCWCIGKAATKTQEFYTLPVDGRLYRYDNLALSVVTKTKNGDINTCDIPFSEDLQQFNRDYLSLTKKVYDTCQTYALNENYMVIGTSVLADYEIDGVVNIYAGIYNNPFLIWGKYRKHFCKTVLPISFQFHHTQMDGIPAARFLQNLQKQIDRLKV